MEFPTDDEPSERGGETPNGIHDPAAHHPTRRTNDSRANTRKLTPRMISNWQKNGSLRRYAETSYWLHKDGAVLLRQSSGFVYAELTVDRNDYTYVGNTGVSVHVMMMRAFGKYRNGLVVMHMDNDKENNALSNLQMGTNEENGVGNAVQITIQHADGTEVATTYRSESEAARRVGIIQRPSTRTENVNVPTRRASSRRVTGSSSRRPIHRHPRRVLCKFPQEQKRRADFLILHDRK